jgi:hypothetical protein
MTLSTHSTQRSAEIMAMPIRKFGAVDCGCRSAANAKDQLGKLIDLG